MKTRSKDIRDRWPSIGVWRKVGEGSRKYYDYGRTKELIPIYDAALSARAVYFMSAHISKNWSGGGGVKAVSSSGGSSGRGKGTDVLYHMKVVKGRRKGKLRREEEEHSVAQTEGAFKETSDSGYVNSGTPSIFFSIVNGIMDEINIFEASEEEKSWREAALYSAMYCEGEMGQNQGRVLNGWRKCCHADSLGRNMGG